MKHIIKSTLFGLVFGASAIWAADCTMPEPPSIPDGSKASMDEMLQGKAAVADFQKKNATYLNCMSEQIDAAKSALTANADANTDKEQAAETEKKHTMLVDGYNKGVATEEALANQFNTAIREYKKANAK